MQKRLVAFYCSPREGGNSDTMLDAALTEIKKNDRKVQVQKYRMYDLKIGPCTACGDCYKTRACTVKDDFQRVFDDVLDADVVLFASPIYFMGPPAPLKAFIDRCLCAYAVKMGSKKTPKKRYGAVFLAAGDPSRSMFRPTVSILKAAMWSLDIKYIGEVLAGNLDKRKAVKRHPRIIAKVRKLARAAYTAGK